MNHKVYLVGAGPGDPGLITLRGAEVLQQADVVVYDFLANEKLLHLVKKGTDALCVGKRAGRHSRTQEEINRLLKELWQEGKNVVRLKGGDPLVFGRGGEEALYLAKAKIPFEVIPGVTAGIAGLAYAGIPPTHRNIAVSATLVTGHEDPTKESSDLDLKALAACGGTLVVYMGVRNLAYLVKGLIKGGLAPDTPAAMVYKATLPNQKVVTARLDQIHASAKKAGIKPPALLVVGKVVKLQPDLGWFERLPLFGKQIVITQPLEQSERQRRGFEKLGARVVEFPAITILAAKNYNPLDRCIKKMDEFSFLIFTSANAVNFFFQRLHILGYDARRLAGCRVCVIGPGTREALEMRGIFPDLMPQKFTSKALVEALAQKWMDISGKKALLPRADIAPDHLPNDLKKTGIIPVEITSYRNVPTRVKGPLQKAIEGKKIHAITFASSSAARNFINNMGQDFLNRCKGDIPFVSIGPLTSQTLMDMGFPPKAEAKEHTIPGLVQAVLEIFQKKN